MATYSSKSVVVDSSAAAVSDKFSDFTRLQPMLDAMPADQRAKVGDIALTSDSIIMKTPQVGDITLKVTERTPEKICLSAVGSPVPMNLAVNIKPLAENQSELSASMDVDIPLFLRPMIGGTLQKAVDQFGDFMKRIMA